MTLSYDRHGSLLGSILCLSLIHSRLSRIVFFFLLIDSSLSFSSSDLRTSSPPASVFSLLKADLCALDLEESRNVLDLVQVAPESRLAQTVNAFPRILCFVNTISIHHKTRAQAVAETWGQRCDTLIFFSNVTDTIVVKQLRFEVIKVDVIADHNHLWQKHRATLRYVHKHFRHEYDWFYKADDDAYVVMENLRKYVRRPEIMQKYKREPMQMGHRLNLTQDLVSYYLVDAMLETIWRSRWDRWVFNSGGPGYIMNRLYLDKIVSILLDWTCMSSKHDEMMPDDATISFCMMWHNVFPWDTRDLQGRERWHAMPPGLLFFNKHEPGHWYIPHHNNIGGVRWKQECAAPDSVAFHYINPPLMYHVERTLYFCRSGDDVQDIAAFNEKYDLFLGDNVTVY